MTVARLLDGVERARQLGAADREGQVRLLAVGRDVLDDHVHIDAGIGERTEDRGGDARLVRDAVKRDLRLVARIGDAGDRFLFHDIVLVAQKRAAGIRVEGRQDAHRHAVKHGNFHRAGLEHLGPQRRHLEHFLERDLLQAPGLGDDARIGGVDAVDIGVDVAAVRLEGRRHGHRAGVGAAPAERGDAVVVGDALEAGDHGHLALGQALVQELGLDLLDPGRAVHGRGPNRDLPAQPGAGADADGAQRHGRQSGRDLLAGRDHHVIFARVVQGRELAGPAHELVGLARHGRDHHGHLIAAVDLTLHQIRHMADAVEVGHRGAAEFHNNLGHPNPGPCETMLHT